MDGRLKGQVAVVTGASGGLGAHFARVLAREGAAVALTARRRDRVEAEAAAIAGAGGRAMGLALDITDAAAIGPALDAVEAALGPISILVNNAGVNGQGRALEISVEDWDQAYAVNVRGAFLAAREAARRMMASEAAARGDARIINIASIASETVLPGLPAYCSSKAAVAMLTKSLAREWARYGIAVNALAPGYIETELNGEWFASDAGKKQIQTFPRRRMMADADLDEALVMLAGPAARAITGSLIVVDDGQSLVGGG